MKNRCQLLFTVAVKDELPPSEHISERTYHIRALKAGALKGNNSATHTVIFVITGVGLKASREAAEWIRDNVAPTYIVNIGTTASLNKSIEQGVWVTPNIIANSKGIKVDLDTRLPFMISKDMKRVVGGKMLSVTEPLIGNDESPVGADFVDMESFAQASTFNDTSTSFHLLKMVTDHGGAEAETDYTNFLPKVRDGVEKITAFLSVKDKPDISVIIPVYNRADRIAECVESVLAQTLSPIEIIVVDDGSTDGTRTLLESYGNDITLLVNDHNKGVSFARNRGVEVTQGQWLAFLDSDDRWKPRKLESQWEFIKSHPFYNIIQGEEIWYRNGVRVNPHDHHKKPEGWIFHKSLERCLVSPSSVMMKKELFNDYGPFDESLPACEDYDLWLRITRKHPVGLDPANTVIKHGGHEDQLSARYSAMDRFRVEALQKALGRETDPYFAEQIKSVLHKKLEILINGSVKRNNHKGAEQYRKTLASIEA